jgi:hypothetical protein
MCRQIAEEEGSEKLSELFDALREILANNQEDLKARATFWTYMPYGLQPRSNPNNRKPSQSERVFCGYSLRMTKK